MSPVFGHGGLRLYLLHLLDEEPRHGYEIIRALEDRFLGMYTPSAGTIYPRLAALSDDGLIDHEVIEGKKVYRLTDAGRAELDERRAEVEVVVKDAAQSARALAREIREDVREGVRDLRRELKDAVREVRREERRVVRQTATEARDAARGASRDAARAARDARDAAREVSREARDAARGAADEARRRREGGRSGDDDLVVRPPESHDRRDRVVAERVVAERVVAERVESRVPPADGEDVAQVLRSLRRDLESFVGDVIAAARRHRLDAERVRLVREALLDAREAVIEALDGDGGRDGRSRSRRPGR